MKKVLIITLVCVNVVLLASLILVAGVGRAEAQVYRGGTDYLMVTGKIGTNWEAVYVIDMETRRLLAWRFDRTKNRLLRFRGRMLQNDFRRGSEKK
ncbi:MAG: hypothetical protein ACYSTL_01435 [Planctomycetota bacterium]|jgi:hypothetical protein